VSLVTNFLLQGVGAELGPITLLLGVELGLIKLVLGAVNNGPPIYKRELTLLL
jgi:hypothetical protein